MESGHLRVMFLSPYFRPYLGGIERAIERLSHQLVESPSVEAVGVLTTKYSFPPQPHPEWPDREQTPGGISIYRVAGFPAKPPPFYSVPLVWLSPRKMGRFIDEFNPNVIHFVGDGWFWGHLWAYLWRRRRARFVFTPSYHTLPASRAWLKHINRFLCRRMDRVVTLTRQEEVQVARDYRVDPRNVEVIGWGASVLGSGQPGTAGGAGESGTVDILCVGRLSQHKGQAWLLEVYRRALPQFQRDTRLVLVGQDEDSEASLRLQVEEYGLGNQVVFTGELDDEDLGNWYGRADIFALFSRYEAFGLVYFEAMLSGLPVLTHQVGANQELLTSGSVVVPRFDQEAAVRELAKLVNDEGYRQALGEQGREYAQREFTWQAVADKYLSLYQGTQTGVM